MTDIPNAIIRNGTRSRIRTVKAPKAAWKCPACGRENRPFNVNCPSCYTPRPE